MNVTTITQRPQVLASRDLRAAVAADGEPKDGFQRGEAPLSKKLINSVSWGSGGFLAGFVVYPGAQWLATQAALGLSALGAAGPAFAALALAETALPVITVAATTLGAGLVGWRTAQP